MGWRLGIGKVRHTEVLGTITLHKVGVKGVCSGLAIH
jgi:hypothetical protein